MNTQPGRNAACPCGSGKRYKACCGQLTLEAAELSRLAACMGAGRFDEVEQGATALLARHADAGVVWQLLGAALRAQGKDAVPVLERAATLLPDDAGAHINLGNALSGNGRLEQAIERYRRALALRPEFAEAHHNLGNVLLELGRAEQAAASYRRALDFKPDYPQALVNLSSALRSLGRLEQAVQCSERALQFAPESADAHQALGLALRDLGRLEQAVASYQRALEIRPADAELHTHLGSALRLQGRTPEAEASCRRALAINPAAASTLIVLAESHADRGQFAEAEELLRRAIALEPQLPEAWAGIPKLRRMTSHDGVWLEAAQRLAAQSLPPRQEVPLRYALGKYFEDLADFAQAFAHYQRANELTRLYRVKHDRLRLTQAVDDAIRRFDPEQLMRGAHAGSDSVRPVFIVGMLRSGTTLAEQILASHPAVFGAGELSFWSAAAATQAGAAGLRGLAHDYLQLLQRLSPQAQRVIDKMPANFLHLGLIHAVLPQAHIIHMRRDPIDTCLSIYFQHFESSHAYANDLEDLAHAYSEYLRLMRHWRRWLPTAAMLEVPYEQLVQQPESWSRRMLEFIGLPWDARCLAFERTERSVITASKWQVRQKITQASVGRWRRYQAFIGPLRRLLEEADQPA